MPKLILIISAVLMAAGIVLGFLNRSKMAEQRADKNNFNDQAKQVMQDMQEVVDGMETLKGTIENSELERDLARESIESTDRKVNSLEAQLKAKEQEIKEADVRIAEINQMLGEFEGVTPENLLDRVEDMKRTIAENEETTAQLQQEIEVVSSSVERTQSSVTALEETLAKRNAALRLNSVEATITAVNQDWGFVVINAGQSKGVSADSRLLIKRGDQNIGQLNVVSIEPNMVVANIVEKSLQSGARVMPGDRVIFEAVAD